MGSATKIKLMKNTSAMSCTGLTSNACAVTVTVPTINGTDGEKNSPPGK